MQFWMQCWFCNVYETMQFVSADIVHAIWFWFFVCIVILVLILCMPFDFNADYIMYMYMKPFSLILMVIL